VEITNEAYEEVLNTDLDHIVGELSHEFGQLAGKTLLITGAAGFLGYYLVLSAVHWNRQVDADRKIRVIALDSFFRGKPRWLVELADANEVELIVSDLSEPVSLPSIDYIIHAAGIASPMIYRKYPIECIDANVNGLRYLLDFAVEQGRSGHPISGFLFYSSSEIYGDPDPAQIPTPETYRGNVSCTGPRACYDESKRFGETLCVTYAQVHGLPITAARPFNNYGPGLKLNDGRVLPDFCRCVLQNEDIVMFSDGTPSRTFCYSADAIVGYYKVLVVGKPGEAYNVGTETPEISMKDLADMTVATAKDLFGYEGRVVRQVNEEEAYLVDNPNRRCPDITKAKEELGYRPAYDLQSGVRRTIIWYSKNMDPAGI
jgi:nucleoside-diphosphate-sugar epimerase